MYEILILYRQKLLTSWLTLIPTLEKTIENHYQQDAMLKNVNSENSVYQKVIVAITHLQRELPIVFYPQQPNQSDSLRHNVNKYFITQAYIHAHINAYICTYIATYISTYVCMHTLYVCTYVCAYVYVYIYTYM